MIKRSSALLSNYAWAWARRGLRAVKSPDRSNASIAAILASLAVLLAFGLTYFRQSTEISTAQSETATPTKVDEELPTTTAIAYPPMFDYPSPVPLDATQVAKTAEHWANLYVTGLNFMLLRRTPPPNGSAQLLYSVDVPYAWVDSMFSTWAPITYRDHPAVGYIVQMPTSPVSYRLRLVERNGSLALEYDTADFQEVRDLLP